MKTPEKIKLARKSIILICCIVRSFFFFCIVITQCEVYSKVKLVWSVSKTKYGPIKLYIHFQLSYAFLYALIVHSNCSVLHCRCNYCTSFWKWRGAHSYDRTRYTGNFWEWHLHMCGLFFMKIHWASFPICCGFTFAVEESENWSFALWEGTEGRRFCRASSLVLCGPYAICNNQLGVKRWRAMVVLVHSSWEAQCTSGYHHHLHDS